MLILVLLCENERQRWDASRYIKARSEAQRFNVCENERQRWDASRYIKARSEAQRFYVYRDASHLWRSFSHNRTKINIQNL